MSLVLTLFPAQISAQGKTPAELLKSSPLTTDKDKQLLQGNCESDPYEYLEKRHPSKGANSFITPTTGGTKGIDSALACRLMKLFQHAEIRGCKFTISSAMRPTQMCNPNGGACAPQGKSCHQYGLAVDIKGPSYCLAWVTNLIGRNTSKAFGLHVAYKENGNYRHIQCAEHPRAGRSSCTGSCQGGKSFGSGDGSGPGSSSPSGGITSQLRDALGMNQQPQPAAQSAGGGQPAAQPQPAPQAQPQPMPQPMIPQQPLNQPQILPKTTPLSNEFDTPTTTDEKPSVAQKLIDLAYGEAAQENASSSTSTIPLILDGKDIASVTSKEKESDPIPYYNETLAPSNTFASGELRNSDGNIEDSVFLQALHNIQNALRKLLEILRPFGLRTAIEGDEHPDHLE